MHAAICDPFAVRTRLSSDRRARRSFGEVMRETFSGIALSLGGQEHQPPLKRPRPKHRRTTLQSTPIAPNLLELSEMYNLLEATHSLCGTVAWGECYEVAGLRFGILVAREEATIEDGVGNRSRVGKGGSVRVAIILRISRDEDISDAVR